MSIKSVGLVVNRSKVKAVQFALEVIAYLTERDVEVVVDSDSAPSIGREDLAVDEEGLRRVELIITLGGDGTILSASHIVAPHGIPILGIHMGHFGFISEAHPRDLLPNLDRLLDEPLQVEERMMVRGEVVRNGEAVFTAVGLNDIVINKGAMARMLNLHTEFGGNYVATYPADGVIVATPTGSTAYALSAGGPLVESTVQALLFVPICAHTLAARPIVIPATETVSVTIESDGGEVLFIADSYRVYPLATHDRVEVRRAEYTTRIVKLGGASFYRKVRERLLWGERLNA